MTTYTNQFTIGASAYVDLGAGPLKIALATTGGVWLIASDAQPSLGAIGVILNTVVPLDFPVTTHVWALAINGSAVLEVTQMTAATNGVQNTSLAAVATAALASSLVLKSSAGNLMSLDAVVGATGGFLMLFDATSAPADGAVTPKWVYPIPASGALNMGWINPLSFATGIVAVFSSTGPFTKTASSTAFISGQVQ
jgi:hypothetical protein